MSNTSIDPSKPFLDTDARDNALQTFVPDPAKSQVNSAMTGNITFQVGAGGTVNCTGWLGIRVDPTADSTYYFNLDTTKTFPIYSGVANFIPLLQLTSGQSVTLVLGAATASVQGT